MHFLNAVKKILRNITSSKTSPKSGAAQWIYIVGNGSIIVAPIWQSSLWHSATAQLRLKSISWPWCGFFCAFWMKDPSLVLLVVGLGFFISTVLYLLCWLPSLGFFWFASCFLRGDISLIVVDNLPLLLVAGCRKSQPIIWHQPHSPKAALIRDSRFHLIAITQRHLPSRASDDVIVV